MAYKLKAKYIVFSSLSLCISLYFVHLQPGFEDGLSSDRNPIRYCAVSSIEHGHKTSVTDVQWIPDHMEVTRNGCRQ